MPAERILIRVGHVLTMDHAIDDLPQGAFAA